jgi:hypothetical protein
MKDLSNKFHIVNRQGSPYRNVRNTLAFNVQRARMVRYARAFGERATQSDIEKSTGEFNSRNIVFTVTAGRTGTDTLSKICNLPESTLAEHEPMPHYRYFLGLVQKDVKLAAHVFSQLKVPYILSTPHKSYVETTHLFCKGFLEPCLAYGFRPSLVILTRNARQVATSLLQKNAVPGAHGAGYRHLIAPNDSVFLKLDSKQQCARN